MSLQAYNNLFIILMQVILQPFNSKLGGTSGTNVHPSSHTVDIKLKTDAGKSIKVTNMHQPVNIVIKRKGDEHPNVQLNDRLPVNTTTLVYNTYRIRRNHASFHVDVTPESPTVQYIIVIGYNTNPQLKSPAYYEHLMVVPQNLSMYYIILL